MGKENLTLLAAQAAAQDWYVSSGNHRHMFPVLLGMSIRVRTAPSMPCDEFVLDVLEAELARGRGS